MVLLQFGDVGVYERAEDDLGRGLTLHEVIEAEFATVRAPLDEVTAWLVQNVRVRPGLEELVERFRPLVVSSGFHELIEPVLEREGVAVELRANRLDARPDGWQIRWSDESVCAVCGEPCKRASVADGPFIYVGDGYSDRCVALAAERVFARDGLAEYLVGGASHTSRSTRSPRSQSDSKSSDRLKPVTAVRPESPRPPVVTPPCRCSRSPSRTTSRSRPSASERSGPTTRTSGTRAGCSASSVGARCGSRRRRAACTWSRSTRRSRRRSGGCSGCRSTSTPSTAGRGGPTRSLGRVASALSGFRPPLAPSPFESLVTSISAQQVSLFAAFAIRNRLIERFGERGEHAFSFPTRERLADAERGRALRARLLPPQGRVRRRPRPVGPRPRRPGRAPGRRGQGADHGAARAGGVDRRLVPRPPPRPAAARGRPATSACARRSPRSMVTRIPAPSSSDSTPSRT